MLLWAIFFVSIVIAFIYGMLTHKGTNEETVSFTKSFFDFSAGQKEEIQLRIFLSGALAGAKTDADFERNFRQAIKAHSKLDADLAWAWLNRFLMEYRRANEFSSSALVLTKRFLQDIERRYNLKDE